MSGLAFVGQDDFSAGVLRGTAPDVQPGVGLWNAANGLLNDDGDIYRRGGTTYASATVGNPITFIWTGFLSGKAATLFTTAAGAWTIDINGNPVLIGGPGLAAPVLPAVAGGKLFLPNGYSWDGVANALTPWVAPPELPAGGRHLCAAAGRLLVATGSRIAMSVADDPTNFVSDDFHDLPAGVVVMGMQALRDTAFVFTNYGLWTITNLAFDLTDDYGNVQQQLQLVTPEISLWHESGLCQWAGTIVAPCTDRCFLVDGINAPRSIVDSIPPYYMTFVRAGLRPGGAKVFRNHLFLPVISPAGVPQTVLVCRLNRPVKGRMTYYPWSTITGFGSQMIAADMSYTTAAPRFLAAHASGRLVSYTDVFTPSQAVTHDADGSAFEFDVETRDFPTGNGQPNHVRRLRLRYTLDGDASLTAGYSTGSQSQRYEDVTNSGMTYTQVRATYPDYAALRAGPGWTSGLPPSDSDPERFWTVLDTRPLIVPGLDPAVWEFDRTRRTRYIRARFRMTDAPAGFVIHGVDFAVRAATHNR